MTADTCTYQISSLAQLKMRYKFKKSKTKCVQVYMFIQCLMLSCHSVINQSNRFYFRIRNGIFFVCVCYNVAWYVAHTQLVFCRCGFLRAWHYPFLHINKGTHTHTYKCQTQHSHVIWWKETAQVKQSMQNWKQFNGTRGKFDVTQNILFYMNLECVLKIPNLCYYQILVVRLMLGLPKVLSMFKTA